MEVDRCRCGRDQCGRQDCIWDKRRGGGGGGVSGLWELVHEKVVPIHRHIHKY